MVELLVVVTIIMILASMILTAVESATDKASMAKCVSNLKQLGTATHLYAGDNDRVIPNMKDGNILYADIMLEYLGNDNNMWMCPSENPVAALAVNNKQLHYGCNKYDYDDVDGDGVNNHAQGPNGMSLGELVGHSNIIWLVDAKPGGGVHDVGGAQSGSLNWPMTDLKIRHNGRYNAAYLDGSGRTHLNQPNHLAWATPTNN
jgi:prepilin-type processing-associated H-X9-DG protein